MEQSNSVEKNWKDCGGHKDSYAASADTQGIASTKRDRFINVIDVIIRSR